MRPHSDPGRPLARLLVGPARLLAGLVVVLLLLSGGSAAVQLLQLGPAARRSSAAAEQVRSALQAMVDQETGVRGYLLDAGQKDGDFLQPYRLGRQAYQAATAQALRLVADDRRLSLGLQETERRASA